MRTTLLIALALSMSANAKDAMDDTEYRVCWGKLQAATQNAQDSAIHTNHCHYFAQSCGNQWRGQIVPAQFDRITEFNGVQFNQTQRLRATAAAIGRQCMAILDRKRLQ